MHIRHLQLRNWKNFQSAEIRLPERAFFIGPNASGKSNLFDAIRFLSDLAAAQGGGLQAAVARRRGLPAIRCLEAKRDSTVEITVEIGGSTGPRWRYELAIEGSGKPGDRRPFLRREIVARFDDGAETLVLQRPDSADDTDPERRTQTSLEQTSANLEFREVAEFFRSVRYLHVVPQIIRDPARIPDAEDDPFGGDLLQRIARTTKRTREARIARMAEALKVAVPQFDTLELVKDDDGKPHLRARYRHWRPQGAWQQEDQFSDGTLRLLGLIWALQESGGPLLMEEPEMSLHKDVVAHLPRMIARATRGTSGRARRQVLISTHSPDLLAEPGIGLDEVFWLVSEPAGTAIRPATTIEGAEALLAEGIPLPEVVMRRARPRSPEALGQLDLFG
jgi:predicted ATPase